MNDIRPHFLRLFRQQLVGLPPMSAFFVDVASEPQQQAVEKALAIFMAEMSIRRMNKDEIYWFEVRWVQVETGIAGDQALGIPRIRYDLKENPTLYSPHNISFLPPIQTYGVVVTRVSIQSTGT
jgi:hypothetical protein